MLFKLKINKLEQLYFKLEKIIGILKPTGKGRKDISKVEIILERNLSLF